MDLVSARSSFFTTTCGFPVSARISLAAASPFAVSLQAMITLAPARQKKQEQEPRGHCRLRALPSRVSVRSCQQPGGSSQARSPSEPAAWPGRRGSRVWARPDRSEPRRGGCGCCGCGCRSPLRASSRAVSLPMPVLAPVMTAALPSSRAADSQRPPATNRLGGRGGTRPGGSCRARTHGHTEGQTDRRPRRPPGPART